MNTTADLRAVFTTYRTLAEKAMAQVADADLERVLVKDGNSIAIVVKHMAGNMRSRFTDFLTTDGEKPWRHRDTEFEGGYSDRAALLADWNSGWACFFAAVDPLTDADLARIVRIRNEEHTVMQALLRQLAHYATHVGQIVLLARTFAADGWTSLSIPRGKSEEFNAGMMGRRA